MPSDLKTSESDAQSVGSIEENELHSSAAVNSPSVSTPERASSVQRYEEEWSQLCVSLEKLRYHAIQGDFRASRFRSICWRVLLGLFTPGEPDKWVEEARKARKHYRKLKELLNRHPWSESEKEVRDDNPLSQEAESTWNQYFCDKELRVVIQQDVTRTFPGVDFFRDKDIQNSMVDILFCYAREFPRMCYRQGMHEILAPLIFVTYCDHQAYLHTRECDTLCDVMCDVLNPECLVEDSYMMFRKIMESAGIAYQTSDILPTPTGYFPSRTASGMSASSGENQMMGELNWIRDFLLKPADEKLYKHLQQLDIPLPLFGIRWLRLLFGREFPLQDLLVLWDAIFAEGSEFELVNYIVVAMLLAIGEQLLSSGYTECMNLLMRYPPTSDISYIIKKALHLKDPMLYSDPVMVASQISRPTKSEDSSPPSSPRSPSRNDRPYNLDKKQTSKHVAAITNSIKRVSIRKRRVTTPSAISAQESSSIIDGYTLQDPSLLKTELKQVQELMKFCRLKLLQYHGILLKQVPSSDNIAQQALVGIHELCSLMDEQTYAPSTPSPRSVEIEPAFEVGESSRLSLISPLMTPVTPAPGNQSAFDLPPPKTDVVMKTFKEIEGPVIESALIISPSHSIPSSPPPSPSPSSSAR